MNLDGGRPRTKIILKPEQFRGAKKKAKVTIECDSENMSRQKQARVTIVVDGVQLSKTIIMPDMEITLFSEYDDISGDDRVFLLAKDYDPSTY